MTLCTDQRDKSPFMVAIKASLHIEALWAVIVVGNVSMQLSVVGLVIQQYA